MNTNELSAKSGDQFLSGFELNLWRLHQDILYRFGVYAIFKWRMMNAPERKNGMLQWFVPDPCENQQALMEFLEQELREIERAPTEEIPGEEVAIHKSVHLFRGIDPYMTRATLDKVVRDFVGRHCAIEKSVQ